MYEGEKLSGDSTPEEVGLEDGDQIDAMVRRSQGRALRVLLLCTHTAAPRPPLTLTHTLVFSLLTLLSSPRCVNPPMILRPLNPAAGTNGGVFVKAWRRALGLFYAISNDLSTLRREL